jgi:hypothetical protein
VATTKKKRNPRREGALEVLMNREERAIIDAGAAAEGLPTGTWLRSLGLREAKKKSKEGR